jgi:adenine-specific DNA-methyltransferase
MQRLDELDRLLLIGSSLRYVRYLDDFPVYPLNALWGDTGVSGFSDQKLYVVQTNAKVVMRCLLMCTDPGDLVLDPTCGSGTTAYVAEQWGRRWITIDTSRVPLALALPLPFKNRWTFFSHSSTVRDGTTAPDQAHVSSS